MKGDSHQIRGGECRLGRDIHGLLPRYPSLVNFVAVTFSVHDHTRVPMLGTSEVGIATIYCKYDVSDKSPE